MGGPVFMCSRWLSGRPLVGRAPAAEWLCHAGPAARQSIPLDRTGERCLHSNLVQVQLLEFLFGLHMAQPNCARSRVVGLCSRWRRFRRRQRWPTRGRRAAVSRASSGAEPACGSWRRTCRTRRRTSSLTSARHARRPGKVQRCKHRHTGLPYVSSLQRYAGTHIEWCRTVPYHEMLQLDDIACLLCDSTRATATAGTGWASS